MKMENHMPLATKKICNFVRALHLMLGKGISKKKLMLDLNMMIKRGNKIAGKAFGNLMFHHHHHHHSDIATAHHPVGPHDYEFSCSNSPANNHPIIDNLHHFFPSLHLGKNKKGAGGRNNFFGCAHLPPTLEDEPIKPLQLEQAVLEFLNSYQPNMTPMIAPSPMLPGFGQTPLVRQLRITDSPFPLKSEEADEDGYVDKAAEEFIQRFYNELRRQ